MLKNVIELKYISKSYSHNKGRVDILKGLNFKIKNGDILCIYGEAGSGKTLLLKIIGGQLISNYGDVIIDEKSFRQASDQVKAKLVKDNIGFVFKEFELLPYLSVLGNIALPALLTNNRTKAKELATSKLEEVQYNGKHNIMPSSLSVGQKQKVSLARALANDPDFILVDDIFELATDQDNNDFIKLLDKVNKDGVGIVVFTSSKEICSKFKNQYHIKNSKILKI